MIKLEIYQHFKVKNNLKVLKKQHPTKFKFKTSSLIL